jgi:NADH-quinone oxidoreductase subunit C
MANKAYREDPGLAKRAIELVRAEFGEGVVLSEGEWQGQAWAVVARQRLVEVARFLRDHADLGFDYLRDLCGMDNMGHAPFERRFQVVYQLYSLKHQQLLRLKVDCPEEDPVVPSLVPVYLAADWQEREAFDMYGIRFEGHPDLRRILMPEDYRHHPQRMVFPI